MIFEESVFIFQFLNDKMHNYVLFNAFVRFIIQFFDVKILSYVCV